MNGKHVKLMLLSGAGLFGLLLLTGSSVSSAVFIAIALACPLMMLFMMGGHGGSTDAGGKSDRADDRTDAHRHDR